MGRTPWLDPAGPASPSPVLRTPREFPTTADAIVREIQRLYRELQALPLQDQPVIEAQIYRLARRHWDLTDVA